MKTSLLYAAAAAALVFVALVAHQTYLSGSTAPGVIYVQSADNSAAAGERVIDLPEDAGLWQTVFIYQTDPPTDPASRQLKAIFASNARLRSLLAQTKVFEYSASDRLYRLRYSQLMGGATPQLWLQTAEGQVIYKASGANLPSEGEQLADEIQTSIGNSWPCPRPKPPQPQPVPVPVPVPVPQPVIPDIRPIEPAEPAESSFPIAAGVALVVGAGLLGLYIEWQRSK